MRVLIVLLLLWANFSQAETFFDCSQGVACINVPPQTPGSSTSTGPQQLQIPATSSPAWFDPDIGQLYLPDVCVFIALRKNRCFKEVVVDITINRIIRSTE